MKEFNTAIFNCGLSGIPFDGSLFTWTNGRVWQWLDRVLMNNAWTEAYEFSHVSHLVKGQSDHALLLIKCRNGG